MIFQKKIRRFAPTFKNFSRHTLWWGGTPDPAHHLRGYPPPPPTIASHQSLPKAVKKAKAAPKKKAKKAAPKKAKKAAKPKKA